MLRVLLLSPLKISVKYLKIERKKSWKANKISPQPCETKAFNECTHLPTSHKLCWRTPSWSQSIGGLHLQTWALALHLSLLFRAQYKQQLYPIEIFRAQNHKIIRAGRDLWDHQVQQWLVSVQLMGRRILLSIFLQRSHVSLKSWVQSCCFISSMSKADLYPLWKKIMCPGCSGSTDPVAQGTCSAFGYKQKREKFSANVS